VFNNPYEESKSKAEDLIQNWTKASGIPHSICRLPIIIGNSQTGKTLTFNGFYGFFKPFWRLENSIREKASDARFREAGIRAVDGHIEVPLFVKCHSPYRNFTLGFRAPAREVA
jgi:thioester reductase-like protein